MTNQIAFLTILLFIYKFPQGFQLVKFRLVGHFFLHTLTMCNFVCIFQVFRIDPADKDYNSLEYQGAV